MSRWARRARYVRTVFSHEGAIVHTVCHMYVCVYARIYTRLYAPSVFGYNGASSSVAVDFVMISLFTVMSGWNLCKQINFFSLSLSSQVFVQKKKRRIKIGNNELICLHVYDDNDWAICWLSRYVIEDSSIWDRNISISCCCVWIEDALSIYVLYNLKHICMYIIIRVLYELLYLTLFSSYNPFLCSDNPLDGISRCDSLL